MSRKYKQNRDINNEAPDGLRRVTLLIPNDVYITYKQIANDLNVKVEDLIRDIVIDRVQRKDEKIPSPMPSDSSMEHDNPETSTYDEGTGKPGDENLPC